MQSEHVRFLPYSTLGGFIPVSSEDAAFWYWYWKKPDYLVLGIQG